MLPAAAALPVRSVPDCAAGKTDVALPRQSRTRISGSPRTVTTRFGSIGRSNFSRIGAHFPSAQGSGFNAELDVAAALADAALPTATAVPVVWLVDWAVVCPVAGFVD